MPLKTDLYSTGDDRIRKRRREIRTLLTVLLLLAFLTFFHARAGAEPEVFGKGGDFNAGANGEGEKDDIDPDNLVLVGEKNDEVTEDIKNARLLVGSGRFAHAVEAYQRIIELSSTEYANSYMALDFSGDCVYIPARRFCMQEIRAFPRELRKIYNDVYNPKAAGLLEKALAESDLGLLEKTASDYILTTSGKRAAGNLVDILIAKGAFQKALYFLELVSSQHPSDRSADVYAKTMFCCYSLEDVRGMRVITSSDKFNGMREEKISFRGTEITLGQYADGLLERMKPGRGDLEAAYNSFTDSVIEMTGEPGIKGVNPDAHSGDKYWKVDGNPVTGTTTTRQDNNRRRRFGPPGYYQNRGRTEPSRVFPVFIGNRMLFRTNDGLFSASMQTGKLTCEPEKTVTSRNGHGNSIYGGYYMNMSSPTVPLAMDVRAGVIYTLASSKNSNTQNQVVAVDVSKKEFRKLWESNLTGDEEMKEMQLNAPPVTRGGNVYTTGIKNFEGKEWRFYLIALDRKTGRMRWKTHLCTMAGAGRYMRYYGISTTRFAALTEARGSVYVSSNTGVIARVSANTGRVVWVKKYIKPKRKRNRYNPWGIRNRSLGDKWNLTPPIYSRKTGADGKTREIVVAAPSDSHACIGIDPETGRYVYRIFPLSEEKKSPGQKFLVGPWKGYFFICGEKNDDDDDVLVGHDLFNGKTKMILKIPGDEAVRKACIAGNSLYLPGKMKIHRILLDPEKLTRSAPVESRLIPKIDHGKLLLEFNGLPVIFKDRIIIAGYNYICSYPCPPAGD